MNLSTQTLTLRLATPFKLAHGTSTERHSVIVKLDEGIGEAALPPYYNVTPEDAIAYLESEAVAAALDRDLLLREDILDALPPGPAAARAALDMALHDLAGKRLGVPLYRMWGLNPARAPLSSFTLGIETDEALFREQLRAVAHYPILKLKLGSGNIETDEAAVRIAQEETGAQLYVDANAGWSVGEASRIIPRLAKYKLLFVEQPIAQHDTNGWHHLRRMLPSAGMPPLIADESIHNSEDILPLAQAVDGINIKLAKAGGLREAMRMIQIARALGMRVMLGCMVESAVGVTAAAHLAPLVDYTDLDGMLLLENSPYQGMEMGEDGVVHLPDAPGLGIKEA